MTINELKALFRAKIKVVTGGPTNRTRGAGLIEALDALAVNDFRGANSLRIPLKVVAAPAAMRALDPLTCCLGTECIVLSPPARFRLAYVEHPAAWAYVCRDGDFEQGTLTDAEWFPLDAAEAGVPSWSQLQAAPPAASYPFPDKFLIRHAITPGGTEFFFESIGAGVWPAPTAQAGDMRWKAVARQDVPVAFNGAFGSLTGDPLDNAALAALFEQGPGLATPTVSGTVKLYTGPGPNTDGAMSQAAVTNALKKSASVQVAGVTQVFATYELAEAAASPGDTITLSGYHSAIAVDKSVTVTGGTVYDCVVGYASSGITARITGLTALRRFVVCPRADAQLSVDFSILSTGPDFFFESFAFLATGGSAVAQISVSAMRARNAAAYAAPVNALAGNGVIRFQERYAASQWTVQGADLSSVSNPVVSGYPLPASRVVLAGSTTLTPGAGKPVQETAAINQPANADAAILVDNRAAGGGIDYANPQPISSGPLSAQTNRAYTLTGAGFAITLPDAGANRGAGIYFEVSEASTPGAFPIAGTDFVLFAGESLLLRSGVNGWVKQSGKMIPMSAVLSTQIGEFQSFKIDQFSNLKYTAITSQRGPADFVVQRSTNYQEGPETTYCVQAKRKGALDVSASVRLGNAELNAFYYMEITKVVGGDTTNQSPAGYGPANAETITYNFGATVRATLETDTRNSYQATISVAQRVAVNPGDVVYIRVYIQQPTLIRPEILGTGGTSLAKLYAFEVTGE